MFDKAINKALINKNTINNESNPKLIDNSDVKAIKNEIIEGLKNAKTFDIAVSYVVWSGLSIIYKYLKKYDNKSRLLVTTEGMVTDIVSLKKLLKLDIDVRVYIPKTDTMGFHLKSYVFKNDEYIKLIIGSNNLSARAFGLSHEMAMVVNSKVQGEIVDSYQKTFESLWNSEQTYQLSDEIISLYDSEIKNKNEVVSYKNNLKTHDFTAKPNYMQEKALRELEECRKLNTRGLVIAATGTGKTYLSAFDVQNSNAKKVLFLVHNRLILSSAILTYKNVFKNKKIIELDSSNIKMIESADFIFTTDKTAHKYLVKKYNEKYFDYIIFDEAHRIGRKTKYQEIIEYFKPKFMLGLTATPERTDNKEYLFKVFEYNIPYEIRLLEALYLELVAPFTYYGLNLDEKLLKKNEDFNYYELAYYLKKNIEEKGFFGDKLKAIVFCSTINEAKNISKELNNVGYHSFVAVSSDTNNEEISEKILSLKSNEENSVEIICTVNKFNEGIDIPDINMIIMLRNTESAIIYLQQLGRGLRRIKDENKFVTVIDIIGNSKNNYTIANVLTGNQTNDKRKLLTYANKGFDNASPFINVEIEELAMDKIIKSIAYDFKVKSQILNKFRNLFYRYPKIPTLKEMYLNPNFSEMDLLQLLFRNFYEPFEKFYNEKYKIKENSFTSTFFTLITQFVFRGYDKKTLIDYVNLLNGNKINNNVLRQVLFPKDYIDGRITSIYSYYYKKGNNYPKVFMIEENDFIKINEKIIDLLKENNAYELYLEHVELFDLLSKEESYHMELFDLVDKGEFLFNHQAKDCYMNVSGERIDKSNKRIFCMVNITKEESKYDNHIIDDDKIVYYTKASNTKEQAIEKINMLINEKYEFYCFARFPHLGYEATTYFNLGNVLLVDVSEVREVGKGKYNHRIVLKVQNRLPLELLNF